MLRTFKICVLFLLVFMTSCTTTIEEKKTPSEDIISSEFKFKDHTYYFIRIKGYTNTHIVHDPECKKCLDLYD